MPGQTFSMTTSIEKSFSTSLPRLSASTAGSATATVWWTTTITYIETPEGNLCREMRQLNGVYTQAFNRRHGRVGHLFQGCYKSILVDRIEPNLSEKISADEIPRRERLAHRPDLEELFSGQEGKEQRPKAAYQAHVEWGYPLKDIGDSRSSLCRCELLGSTGGGGNVAMQDLTPYHCNTTVM